MSRIRLAAIAAFASPIAIAPAAAQGPIGLPPVIVTGGLTPIEADIYGRSVSVITAEEIEARGIDRVSEALRGLPGVSVSRSGGHGLTNVRLRGAETNHTLVLIDGVEMAAPKDGSYNFGALLAADIARIEVLRGPQSSLYGSNAMGGVISIITKGAREPGLHWQGEAEAGTDATGAAFLALRGRNEAGSFSVSAARREKEGFDISGTPGGEEDGDRNLTLNARGDLDVADWLTVGGTFRLTDRHSDTDGEIWGAPSEGELVFDDDSAFDRREIMGSLFAIAEHGRFRHEARAAYLTADEQTTDAGVNLSDTTGTRRSLSVRSTVALDASTLAAADHSLTLLAENERETFENTDPALVFDPSQLGKQARDLFGFVAEYRGSFFDALDLQASLRQDLNDDFEDATTWSAGASWWVTDVTRLHASVGTAVQNPSFYDQFGFVPGTWEGNPDLEPEESFGWDIGVEQAFWDDRAIIDVTYFRQDLENEIGFVVLPSGSQMPVNESGESERQGVEVAASLQATEALNLGLSYTWLDATNPDGSMEIRRPKHEAAANATWRFLDDRGMLRLDARYVAGNRDNDFREPPGGGFPVTGAQVELDDYVVVDVAGSWELNDRVELFGRVHNLFDTDYQEIHGYNTAGITAFAGVRANW